MKTPMYFEVTSIETYLFDLSYLNTFSSGVYHYVCLVYGKGWEENKTM
jgi:hypothetical protein